MLQPYFYNNHIKNIISIFGSLFDQREIIDDFGQTIKIPLIYAPKEKFIGYYQDRPDMTTTQIDTILPRMGFELKGIKFAPERHTNPLNRIQPHATDEKKFMYNRVPYDFDFTLYIATRKFEDSLKIVEQILPTFTPEFNVTIKEHPEFNITTDIPIVLNGTSFSIDYEGSFDNKRVISWELDFLVRGHLYSYTRTQERIKSAVLNLSWVYDEESIGKTTIVEGNKPYEQ